jgi:hypothetical protein
VIVKWSLAGQCGFGDAGVEDRGAAQFRELQRALHSSAVSTPLESLFLRLSGSTLQGIETNFLLVLVIADLTPRRRRAS